jgi:hypothetical protein
MYVTASKKFRDRKYVSDLAASEELLDTAAFKILFFSSYTFLPTTALLFETHFSYN